LAASHFQLGELTDKIGDKKEALAVHRKALALRRELAAAVGGDVETRLDVARSLAMVGGLLRETGDHAGALAAHEEQRELAERLEAEHSTDAVRSSVASSHHNIARVRPETGKPEEALVSYRQALAIRQKLADANPAVTQFQSGLAASHNSIGLELARMGKPEEALNYLEERLQVMKAKHDPDHPATLVALDGVALVYLAVAAQQAWLGQEQEWAATCERGLSLARDTKFVTLAEKVAKMCSLRPSNDKRRLAALLLARRAVELGKGNVALAWFQIARPPTAA
jgi:tetratricopeptide (TPR) repeat protein